MTQEQKFIQVRKYYFAERVAELDMRRSAGSGPLHLTMTEFRLAYGYAKHRAISHPHIFRTV